MTPRLRDRGGWISGAEGCMFLAVVLFALLLITILVLVYVRWDDRPRSVPPPAAQSGLPLVLPIPIASK